MAKAGSKGSGKKGGMVGKGKGSGKGGGMMMKGGKGGGKGSCGK